MTVDTEAKSRRRSTKCAPRQFCSKLSVGWFPARLFYRAEEGHVSGVVGTRRRLRDATASLMCENMPDLGDCLVSARRNATGLGYELLRSVMPATKAATARRRVPGRRKARRSMRR